MKLLALLFLIPGLALAKDELVLNTGPDVRILIENSRGKEFSEQLKEWDIFEKKYQDIYDAAVFIHNGKDWQKRRISTLKTFFANLSQIEKPMLEIFAHAEEISRNQMGRFRRIFPDLKEGIPLVFLPGFNFNGKATYLGRFKKNALLIAPDNVLAWHENLDVLFSHEFFHIYHFDRLGGDDEQAKTLSSPLWYEGFASYVSEELNPGTTLDEVLMDSSLAQECSKPSSVAAWAKQFLAIYAKDDWEEGEADRVKAEWFKGNSSVKPDRRGYCLGYLAVKTAAQAHSIQELVDWKPENFVPFIGEALNRLSQ